MFKQSKYNVADIIEFTQDVRGSPVGKGELQTGKN